ncbi:tetratricopeptide repeat protein [Chloroflexota bacterium]
MKTEAPKGVVAILGFVIGVGLLSLGVWLTLPYHIMPFTTDRGSFWFIGTPLIPIGVVLLWFSLKYLWVTKYRRIWLGITTLTLIVVPTVIVIRPYIVINPNDAEAYNNRGVTYLEKGEYDRALTDFNKAIKLDPNYALAYYNRGDAYSCKEDLDSALADFTKANKLDPSLLTNTTHLAIEYVQRAQINYKKGDKDGAIADFTKAIELGHNDGWTYRYRARVYNDIGEYDLALVDCNKAIELGSGFWAYYERGWAYAMGLSLDYYYEADYDSAIADFNKAIELNPDYAWTYYYRGFAYHRTGRNDLAIADYRKAIELSHDPSLTEEVKEFLEGLEDLMK